MEIPIRNIAKKMTINREGFLSKEIESWIKKYREKYASFFEIAYEINRLCHRSMFSFGVHNQHLQEITVASLYLRILSNFQAVVLLCERGMIPEANVMARIMLESIFILHAIVKDKKLAEDYVREDQIARRKLFYKCSQLKEKLPSDIDAKEFEAAKNELEEDIQNKCIKSRSTEDWSKEAGMHETYLTAYTILSNTVHSKVRDLQDYFGIDENGEIKTFHWGPSDKGVLRVLATSIEGMLLSLAVTSSFFDKEQNEIIEGYQKKLGKMMSEANIT